MRHTNAVMLAVLSVWAIACGKAVTVTDKVITMGAVVDRTGSQAWQGWSDSIALAETDMNAALRDAGYKSLQFKIVISDSANDPVQAVPRAVDLVKTQGARAIITDSSQDDVAINKLNYDADATKHLDVPIQCSACTSGSINNATAVGADQAETDALHNGNLWNFRGTMPTKLIAAVLVNQILRARGTNGDVNGDGLFKVAMYASNDTSGKSGAADIKSAVTKAADGGVIAASKIEIIYHPADADPNTYNWTADLTRLVDNITEAADGGMTTDGIPDAIVETTFPQLHAATVAAYEAGGFTVPMIHTHNMRNQSAIRSLGTKADGQEGVSHVVLDNGPSGEVFAKELLAKTGTAAAYRDSTFYDNAITLMLATVIATKSLEDPLTVTPAQIRDALTSTSVAGFSTVVRTGPDELQKAIGLIKAGTPINYEGAAGPMDYDANQGVKTRLGHYKITATQAADIEVYDCVAGDACTKR